MGFVNARKFLLRETIRTSSFHLSEGSIGTRVFDYFRIRALHMANTFFDFLIIVENFNHEEDDTYPEVHLYSDRFNQNKFCCMRTNCRRL
jgi:hypothetical protein